MIVAHDLGTTGNKASLHGTDGAGVSTVTVNYPANFDSGGIAEQDPWDWWQAVGSATRQLLARTGVQPSAVTGIGLSGQMMGAVCVDAEHQPVRPALIWADHRSTQQTRQLIERIGQSQAYRILGHRIDPTYSLSKVMWLRDNEPGTLDRTEKVCQAKDFVAAHMTGRMVTDPSDASSTNAYDQRAGTWSALMFEAAGLPTSLFPDIVPSTEIVGGLTTAAAAHLGLLPGTPVVLGGGDGPMAAVGAGVISSDDAPYACLGSSSWISCAARTPLHDRQTRSMTFDHVVPGHYVPTATMQAGGASLSWIAEVFAGAGLTQQELLAQAATVTAADDGLYFLPHLLGERSPYWNPCATGVFAGLKRHHGLAHLARAVLEGVAFNLRTCRDAFTDNGVRVDSVDVIGGGARSDLWLQILADTWQVPIRRRSIVADANSLGAAVTAAVGLGITADFALARNLSTITAVFAPDTDRADRAAAQHQRFLSAYAHMAPWFETDRSTHV